ncbi:MAG: glycosyltransferase [Bacteroidota bacterium]
MTIVELARSISKVSTPVDVVAARETVRYEAGDDIERQSFGGQMRSRPAAAARAILRQSHYLREKLLTPAFVAEASRHLARTDVGVVLHSYLVTASVAGLPDLSRRHLVWSHNDEFAWFEDLREATANPLGKRAASVSLHWLHQFLSVHRDSLTLLHVTEADQAGWERHVPGHRSAVVPIGVALRGHPAPALAPGEPVRLLFSGALSVRMNFDALNHFAERYLPALRARLGDALSVAVVGSSPLPDVEALCAREGWLLHPNVSEEEMDARFREATFSLLPFPYATGAKLKLLKSLAYGVPALCTEAVGAQADLAVPPSLVAGAPEAWADHVVAVRKRGISDADRKRLLGVARAHSWDASAARLLEVASTH